MPTPPQLNYETPPRGARGLLSVTIRAMTGRRARSWAIRMVFAASALVACGYLSNSFSMNACEIRTAKWLAADVHRGKPFHVSPRGEAESERIFKAAGINVLPNPGPGRRQFPYAGVGNARSVVPFVIDVDYGYTFAPLAGAGGYVRYICLFGHVIWRFPPKVVWIS